MPQPKSDFHHIFLLADSNHYGIAGWYSKKAADCSLIVSSVIDRNLEQIQGIKYIIFFIAQGMSFTNTSPFLCPTRAKEVSLKCRRLK